MRKVRKLTQQIEKLKEDIDDFRKELESKEKEKKSKTGISHAEFEDIKKKCSRKIKEKERTIRRKELTRQARLKRLKEKEDAEKE